MRATLLISAIFLLITVVGGCIVRTRAYGPPPRHCYTACERWGYRQACARRCRLWSVGVCMAWESYCRPERVCLQEVTRCR